MSNYATKADLNNATRIHTTKLAAKSDLANLKAEGEKLGIEKFRSVSTNLSNLKNKINKLDIGKIKTNAVDLRKLRNVVKMMLLKRLNIMLR